MSDSPSQGSETGSLKRFPTPDWLSRSKQGQGGGSQREESAYSFRSSRGEAMVIQKIDEQKKSITKDATASQPASKTQILPEGRLLQVEPQEIQRNSNVSTDQNLGIFNSLPSPTK